MHLQGIPASAVAKGYPHVLRQHQVLASHGPGPLRGLASSEHALAVADDLVMPQRCRGKFKEISPHAPDRLRLRSLCIKASGGGGGGRGLGLGPPKKSYSSSRPREVVVGSGLIGALVEDHVVDILPRSRVQHRREHSRVMLVGEITAAWQDFHQVEHATDVGVLPIGPAVTQNLQHEQESDATAVSPLNKTSRDTYPELRVSGLLESRESGC